MSAAICTLAASSSSSKVRTKKRRKATIRRVSKTTAAMIRPASKTRAAMPLDTAKLARSVNKTLGRAVTDYGAAGPVAITAEFRERYERIRVGVLAAIAERALDTAAADRR